MNLIIALGAVNAFLAVAAGAFAAHGLKTVLTAEHLAVFKTAADYQMMHALGMILIGTLSKHDANRCNHLSAYIMLAGIILFSGSLYLLTLSGIRWLGMITPVGGLCFLIAWSTLAFNYLLKKD